MSFTKNQRSFTLVELVVVVAIIIVILTSVIPSINAMWHQSQIKNINLRLTRMIRVARQHSTSFDLPMKAYGLFFYIDPLTNTQAVSFIKTKGVPTRNESYSDVISRFEIDQRALGHTFRFESFLRVSPVEVLDWEDEEIINNSYLDGKHRSFFAIIFNNGKPWTLTDSIFIYDEDKNTDGTGDRMGFKIQDLLGDFGELNNVMYDNNEELVRFNVARGILVYDNSAFNEFPENLRPRFLTTQFDHVVSVHHIMPPVVLHRN